MSFIEQFIRYKLLCRLIKIRHLAVRIRYQCLTLLPTPPVRRPGQSLHIQTKTLNKSPTVCLFLSFTIVFSHVCTVWYSEIKSSPLLKREYFKNELCLYVHILSGWAIAAYKVVDQKLRGSTVMCCEEFAVRCGIGEGDFIFT